MSTPQKAPVLGYRFEVMGEYIARGDQGKTIKFLGSIISPEGKKRVNVRDEGSVEDPDSTGRNAGNKILKMGAKEIVDSWDRP